MTIKLNSTSLLRAVITVTTYTVELQIIRNDETIATEYFSESDGNDLDRALSHAESYNVAKIDIDETSFM